MRLPSHRVRCLDRMAFSRLSPDPVLPAGLRMHAVSHYLRSTRLEQPAPSPSTHPSFPQAESQNGAQYAGPVTDRSERRHVEGSPDVRSSSPAGARPAESLPPYTIRGGQPIQGGDLPDRELPSSGNSATS